MASRKILLIDGNSLIHRAYHAVAPLSTSSGQPTNAAYGFTNMLLLLLEQQQPDAVIVAFDAPGPTFRHELSEDYKANRPPMDEDLASQFGIVRELSKALGLASTELPGWEADDIIGALALRASEAGDDVAIVTGDRDLCQLVTSNVQVLATVRGMTQMKTYDAEAVREEFGVDPPALVDLKGLAGDTSDNIPGIPKVGPKTAAKLLEQFASIDDLYQGIDQVENEKLRERLIEHEESARLSRSLAQIALDAPVDDALLEASWGGPDTTALRRLLAELEFNSLLARVPAEVAEIPSDDIAQTPEAIANLCEKASQADAVGVALAQDDDRPTGIALALGPQDTAYIELPDTADAGGLFAGTGAHELPECVCEVLADESVAKVGHDLKGMARALRSADIRLSGFAFDTALAAYLHAPHRGNPDIDALEAQHLGTGLPSADGPGDEGLPGPAARAVAEAVAALALREPLVAQLEEIGERELFETVEMPMVSILGEMETAGIALDITRLDEIGDKLQGLMTQVSQQVYELAGQEFNLGSPKQIGEVLFGKLGLPKGRKTKTGWSTGAAVLEDLAAEHQIAARLLEHREYSKLKSTYVDGLIPLVSPDDGRIHTTFEQTVVATGRLSSRNPNLQNIPIRSEWGREIRSCFVAQGDGHVLMAADYSQIELRILAHMSQDESLLEAFKQGQDIHKTTAAAIFDVPVDEVLSDMRRVAKTVNYAVVYGMGATALAKQLGIPRKDAKQFIDSYFERLPGVKQYMEQIVERAREEGYVSTLFGRRRPMPDLTSGAPQARAYAERAAANAPLQGTAADIIKIAMVRLAARLPSVAPNCEMLLQVHDDLVFELPERDVDKVAPLVREVMEGAAELDVPLAVEPKVGPNWRDMVYL